MNIKITYNWLLEYLDTDADPYELQKYLSLCGPSIERVTKTDDDYVFDIEITSNRVDMASVVGIAREAAAILPRFGKKAVLRTRQPPISYEQQGKTPFTVSDPEQMTKRILTTQLEGVTVAPSPTFIKQRLETCGVRSLNNIIDITNYVMLEIGHPTHVFDAERLHTEKLLFRKAKKGEKITTLDGKTYELEGYEEVIDDGKGRIVDLPGIMGTQNSVVTDQTRTILFFIDNNSAQIIRKTSMTHGIRTIAATYNEKNPDPTIGLLAMKRGLELYAQYAKPQAIRETVDLYKQSKVADQVITLSKEFLYNRMGVTLPESEIKDILEKLGFVVSYQKGAFSVIVPSFRRADVAIPEDIVEEVARVYGYHNLPSILQTPVYIKQPEDTEKLFALQRNIKYFFKHLGLHEVLNYSMISQKLIDDLDLINLTYLKLKNSISDEITHLRPLLMPSLIKNIADNQGKVETLRFFEIAKTYEPQDNDLPKEQYQLGIVTNTSYEDLKGIVEALFRELNIEGVTVEQSRHPLLSDLVSAQCMKSESKLGEIGQLKPIYQDRLGIASPVYLAVFDFMSLINHTRTLPRYQPINSYASIKLDLTVSSPRDSYQTLIEKAKKTSSLLTSIELVDRYHDRLTLRFYFSLPNKNITLKEAESELQRVKKVIGS